MAKSICFLVMIMMIGSMVVDTRHLLANTGGLGDTTGALLGNTNPGGLFGDKNTGGTNLLGDSNTGGVNVLGGSNTKGVNVLGNVQVA
ncbi:epsin-like [Papaver somniferum]|uniref:epsin-like n=1 Tax=Papaver somniferum TaxID=3469 RepID=UPI000E7060E2|nr:epsin-like [Papaver somniferum]